MMMINIAKDFSKTPGGRLEKEGPYSGEKFREELLMPYYKKAVEHNDKLTIDFDGGYGYATSFLEEAFGGLVRELREKFDLTVFEFISHDEPAIISKVKDYIIQASRS